MPRDLAQTQSLVCRYAHVVPQCLVDSPSAKWWSDWEASGGNPDDLVMHIERHADFDGLAVGWGIGNKKASVEECGEACRAHRRNPQGGRSDLRVGCFRFCYDMVSVKVSWHFC